MGKKSKRRKRRNQQRSSKNRVARKQKEVQNETQQSSLTRANRYLSTQAFAILLAAIIGLGGMVLVGWDSIKYTLFGPDRIMIQASQVASGTIYQELPTLDSLTTRPAGLVGDDEQDRRTKFILAFNLGAHLKRDVEIMDAELEIPCSVQGDPVSFGNLAITNSMIGSYDYRSKFFDEVELYVYDGSGTRITALDIEWIDTEQLVADCKNDVPIQLSNYNLVSAVQNALDRSNISFVLYFDSEVVNENKDIDAIIIDGESLLRLNYKTL